MVNPRDKFHELAVQVIVEEKLEVQRLRIQRDRRKLRIERAVVSMSLSHSSKILFPDSLS